MSDTFVTVTPQVEHYVTNILEPTEPTPLRELRARVSTLPEARMQTHATQARMLGLLAAACKAKRVLEVGTFHGYATAHIALAAPDSQIVTCDIDERAADDARRTWNELDVSNRIDLRLGPALATMEALHAEGAKFDFIFIDADKKNYSAYTLLALQLGNPGALIAIDNTLWRGEVADATLDNPFVNAMRDCNDLVFARCGERAVIIPAWDGLTMIVLPTPKSL